MNRLSLLVAAALLLLTACEGTALRDAEMKDSPEGYEAFLAEYPDSAEAIRLRERIDELRFLRAKSDKTSEAMRTYLTHHPDGAHVDEARKLEDEISYHEAAAENTAEAFRAYLDSHPDGEFVEQARWQHDQLVYLPQISVGEITTQQINMARDPEGPINGWELVVTIQNNGERRLRVVEVGIDYLNAGGASLKTDRWWAVAPDLSGFPTPPEMKPSLRPGDDRKMTWTTAEAPEGWVAGSFAVRVTKVEFKKARR